MHRRSAGVDNTNFRTLKKRPSEHCWAKTEAKTQVACL